MLAQHASSKVRVVVNVLARSSLPLPTPDMGVRSEALSSDAARPNRTGVESVVCTCGVVRVPHAVPEVSCKTQAFRRRTEAPNMPCRHDRSLLRPFAVGASGCCFRRDTCVGWRLHLCGPALPTSTALAPMLLRHRLRAKLLPQEQQNRLGGGITAATHTARQSPSSRVPRGSTTLIEHIVKFVFCRPLFTSRRFTDVDILPRAGKGSCTSWVQVGPFPLGSFGEGGDATAR